MIDIEAIKKSLEDLYSVSPKSPVCETQAQQNFIDMAPIYIETLIREVERLRATFQREVNRGRYE